MSSLNLLQYVCPDAVSLFKKVPLKMLDFNFYWKAVTKVERNYEKLWRIYVTVWLNGNMSVQNFCTIFVCKWTLQDRPANQMHRAGTIANNALCSVKNIPPTNLQTFAIYKFRFQTRIRKLGFQPKNCAHLKPFLVT